MSDIKIEQFPELDPVEAITEAGFSPTGTGGGTVASNNSVGFYSELKGDVYTSRGRFGNGTDYWELNATEMKSANFVTGVSGCRIGYNGNIEANDGNFRGDITGATGTFSGSLSGGSLHIPDLTTANSFHTDSDGNSWWGCNVADFESDYSNANAYILNNGNAKFVTVTVGNWETKGNSFTQDAIGDNIFIGDLSGQYITTGIGNVCIGESAGSHMLGADTNVFIGANSGATNTNGDNNIFIGFRAGYSNVDSDNNVYIGKGAGNASTGTANIFIGKDAGRYETGSYKFFIDSIDRVDEATARTSALIYGIFNSTVASQTLDINATLTVNNDIITTGDLSATGDIDGATIGGFTMPTSQTEDYVIKTNGSSVLSFASVSSLYKVIELTASDNLKASADTLEALYSAGSWTKFKEIKIRFGGTIRTSFTMEAKTTGEKSNKGRIYKNGVAYGTEREITGEMTPYAEYTFTEDLAFEADDLIQVYLWMDTNNVYLRIWNLKLYYDKNYMDDFTINDD